MGAIKFNALQQRCKELGPNIGISLSPSSTYSDVLENGKSTFFMENSDPYEHFLADGQGSKLPDTLDGKKWTLAEYMNLHGYYPCKTRFYCVQVR